MNQSLFAVWYDFAAWGERHALTRITHFWFHALCQIGTHHVHWQKNKAMNWRNRKPRAFATPQLGYKTEHPHAGLIHPRLIHGRHASQCMGLVVASPVVDKQWRRLLRRATNTSPRLSACARQWLHVLTATKCAEDVLFWMVQHELSLQTGHSQLDNKSVTGTLILHTETLFISVERGSRRRILSQTSLKHYLQFSFILKLTIFICKQLKKHLAFSAVQFLCRCVLRNASSLCLFYMQWQNNSAHDWNPFQSCAKIGECAEHVCCQTAASSSTFPLFVSCQPTWHAKDWTYKACEWHLHHWERCV